MISDIINIVGLVGIGWALWRQHNKIEGLELVMGYLLTNLLDEDTEAGGQDVEVNL